MTFFFTMIFMFFVFWRPQDWLWPWMANWNILDVIMVLSTVSFILENNQGTIRIPKNTPQLKLLVGFFFATLMSHVAHAYFAGIMFTIAPIFKLCYVTFILFCVLDRPSRLRSVARLFVVMSAVMSVHAIMQERLGYGFAGHPPLWIPVIGDNPAHTRSLFFGIFGDPNDLAQILATSIPFSFVIFRRRNFLGLVVGVLFSWLFVEAILATHSRGGLVALAGVCSIMLVLILPARWMPTLIILLGVSALFICPYAAGFLDESAMDRVTFWGQANWLFKRNPMFGIGYKMFWMVAENSAAHNAFVSCYTELGMFGYWFWFILIQLGVAGAWRTMMVFRSPANSEEKWIRNFAGLSIAAISGFCASAYFLSRAYQFPLFFLIAILGSLLVVTNNLLPEERRMNRYTAKDVYLMGSVGAFGSIIYIYFSIVILNTLRG